LRIAGAEIVVFHIVFVLSTSEVTLLTTSLLTLTGASWRLLAATFLALVMSSTTHISL
jgi:hypothetical protein